MPQDSPVERALEQARLFRMRLRAPDLCYTPKPFTHTELYAGIVQSAPIEDIKLQLFKHGYAITATLPIDGTKRYVTILYTAQHYQSLLPPKPKHLRRFPTDHACIEDPLHTQPLSMRGDDLGRRLFLEHIEQCSFPTTEADLEAVHAIFNGSKRAPPTASGRAMIRGTAYLDYSILHEDESMPFFHKRGLYYTAARSTAGAVLGIVKLGDLSRPADPEYLVVDTGLRDSFGCTYTPQEDFDIPKAAGSLVLKYPGKDAWNRGIDAGLPLYSLASNHSWLLGFIHWNRPAHFASPLSYENVTRTLYDDDGKEVVILGITGQELAMLMSSGAYEPHTTKELGTSMDPIGAPPGRRFDLGDVIEGIRQHTDDQAKMASLTMSHYVAEWLDGCGLMNDNAVLVQQLQHQVNGEWVSQAHINDIEP